MAEASVSVTLGDGGKPSAVTLTKVQQSGVVVVIPFDRRMEGIEAEHAAAMGPFPNLSPAEWAVVDETVRMLERASDRFLPAPDEDRVVEMHPVRPDGEYTLRRCSVSAVEARLSVRCEVETNEVTGVVKVAKLPDPADGELAIGYNFRKSRPW